MRYIIAYDITDDRRRRKIDKFLSGIGVRVQESVFEACLKTHQLTSVKNQMLAIMDPDLDNVRIYRQCANCEACAEIMGVGPLVSPPSPVLVV
ncbi:MAG: CRISPR-associated endonuclease Cas2 [Proteobacteria bacterium]|jgi:CRISPR-associated protein Cas2|nr:CRISPR-associated endonuclease Cas2 [Pseudomonadota bacterium]NLN61949.1 CRISPR-associated endonuclease Cas2 [Myxococcales bacterium]